MSRQDTAQRDFQELPGAAAQGLPKQIIRQLDFLLLKWMVIRMCIRCSKSVRPQSFEPQNRYGKIWKDMPWNAMECHGMPWNAMECLQHSHFESPRSPRRPSHAGCTGEGPNPWLEPGLKSSNLSVSLQAMGHMPGMDV